MFVCQLVKGAVFITRSCCSFWEQWIERSTQKVLNQLSRMKPLKVNMEPENGGLEKGDSFWKPSVLGSMLVFAAVFIMVPQWHLEARRHRNRQDSGYRNSRLFYCWLQYRKNIKKTANRKSARKIPRNDISWHNSVFSFQAFVPKNHTTKSAYQLALQPFDGQCPTQIMGPTGQVARVGEWCMNH